MFEKEKKVTVQMWFWPEKRGARICKRNGPADTEVSGGGAGGASGSRAEILLQPVVLTIVRQNVPSLLMEVHGSAEIHLHGSAACGGALHQCSWMPEKRE